MSESSYSTGTQLLDYAQLEPFVEIGFDDFRDILESMIEEAPVLLESLASSVQTGNATTGRAQAHSLRGMLLNFGCTVLAARLADVERAPVFPGGDPASIVPELKTLWARTRAELEEWAATQDGSASP
jgi:hypothetical protein